MILSFIKDLKGLGKVSILYFVFKSPSLIKVHEWEKNVKLRRHWSTWSTLEVNQASQRIGNNIWKAGILLCLLCGIISKCFFVSSFSFAFPSLLFPLSKEQLIFYPSNSIFDKVRGISIKNFCLFSWQTQIIHIKKVSLKTDFL